MLSTKVREKSAGKMKQIPLFAVLLVTMITLILSTAPAKVHAQPVEFDEAEVFFEFNSTDLDLGFDIFVDGEPWQYVNVIAPNGRIFRFKPDGSLFDLGNTEVTTESAEPGFCEDIDEEDCTEAFIQRKIRQFQRNFPEGWYDFVGRTVEGDRIEGEAYLSHDLPDPPVILSPQEDDSVDDVRVIRWREGGPDIIGYEAVAEAEIDGETFVNTATLPGDATSFTIAPEFRRLVRQAERRGTLEEYKVEIICRADNLNKTISEVVIFELEEEEE